MSYFRLEEKARWNGEWIRLSLSCFAVTTFFTTALDASANLFGHFFNEKRGAAGRTGLVDRAVPHGIFTGRIFAAGKKCPRALLGALLNKIATAAWLWAFHAQRKRLGRLTFRVRGTGDELAESTGFHQHRTTAFLALLIGGHLFLRDYFQGPVRELFKILSIFAGRLVLVRRAGEKLSISPPFNLHHLAALLAGKIRRWLHRVLGARNVLGLLQIRNEGPVKLPHGHHPRFIAFFDCVQLLLHVRGEIDIDQVRESLH